LFNFNLRNMSSGAPVFNNMSRFYGVLEEAAGYAVLSLDRKALRFTTDTNETRDIMEIVDVEVSGRNVKLMNGSGDMVVFEVSADRAVDILVQRIRAGGALPTASLAGSTTATGIASAAVPPPPAPDSGLPNLGNTCFVNGGLQLLFALPQFADFLAGKELPIAKQLLKILRKDSVESELQEVLNMPEIVAMRDNMQHHADAAEFVTLMLNAVGAIAGRDLNCGVIDSNKSVCTNCERQVVHPPVAYFTMLLSFLEAEAPAGIQQLVANATVARESLLVNCDCGGPSEKTLETKYEQLFSL
jgi:hypothetical protein